MTAGIEIRLQDERGNTVVLTQLEGGCAQLSIIDDAGTRVIFLRRSQVDSLGIVATNIADADDE